SSVSAHAWTCICPSARGRAWRSATKSAPPARFLLSCRQRRLRAPRTLEPRCPLNGYARRMRVLRHPARRKDNMPNFSDENRRRRSIYLLPNVFTTANLFAGFYAVVQAINGRFEIAAIAIFVAMIFDGMDGRVARLTNTQSAFGEQYDSLSDMTSFGIAPALVMYQWVLQDLGRWGWLAA